MERRIDNPVKRRLAADELAIGMLVRLSRSPEIAAVAKASGHDFLFIDLQHALYSLETVGSIARAANGCGVAPFVRVRSCRDQDISVILDSGVTGIVFPDVNTAEDARIAVETCRFKPLGRRSLTGGYPIFDFLPVSPNDTVQALNESTVIVCMIETVEGLQNVEEIAAVKGIDVLLIGLTDLLYSMGKPGALGDPAVMEAVDRVGAACRANGIALGVGGDSDPERQKEHIRRGSRFSPLSTDVGLLIGAATAAADKRRAMHAGPA
jgi:2-keto-3-deoxy-L-rhamnonate aldolase RhmA